MSDWREHRVIDENAPYMAQVQEIVEELKLRGATFFRVTQYPITRLLIVDAWRVQPEDQGPEPIPEDVIGFGR